MGEVIALHPYPGAWEGSPPIFFKVADTIVHREGFSAKMEVAGNGMVEADNPVVTFHKRHKAVPAHDTGCSEHFGPGMLVMKPEFALNFGQIEDDISGREEIFAEVEGEGFTGGEEIFFIERMIECLFPGAIKDLDESMFFTLFIHADSGDYGDGLFLGRCDHFEIPSFEEAVFFAPAVVHFGVPEGAPFLDWNGKPIHINRIYRHDEELYIRLVVMGLSFVR